MGRILKVLVFSAMSFLAAPSLAQEPVNPGTPDTIRELRESAAKDRFQADGDQQRAAQYRELAQKARQLAESTSDPGYKASSLEDATRREASAKELESGIARLRTSADEKDARAGRLETAYNEKYGKKAEPSPSPRREAPSSSPPSSQADWMVEDLMGLWARSSEPGLTLAIVPQLPDEPAFINRIEAHSDRRIWAGTFQKASREGPARAVLTYTPKPEEMNPTIPDLARRAVSGKLVWRLELEPTGDEFNPTLNAKWYPGEVSWKETQLTSASVIGEGRPLEFAFEPIDAVNIESLSYPTVAIKLPNPAHDPSTDPVEALTKGQRFFVRVTLPVEIAREKGAKISVTVRSLTGGSEETIELTGAIGQGQRPVVYSHVDQVTIANCQAMFEARRNPQVFSLPWIWNLVYPEPTPGGCLDIKLKNEELVEIRYGDAAVQVPMYDSWVQRGIARHVEGAARLREVYQSLLVGPYERAVKESAHKRLRMLANYEALRGSDRLTDLHRFFVGEAYLGDAMPALLQTEDATLNALYREENRNPPHVRPDATYFTPLMQATLEGLTGKDLTPKAWTAGNPIVWTSEAEQFYVLRAIRDTGRRLAEDALKATHENWSFGLYEGIVTTFPQGASLHLVLSGKDHFNRPQPRWMRIMAAVQLASSAVLQLNGLRSSTPFMGRSGRTLRPTSGKVVYTGLIARGMKSVDQIDRPVELPSVPKSVQGAKREALALELTPNPPATGKIECATRRKIASSPGDLDAGPLSPFIKDAVEGPRKYVDSRWGPETKVVPGDATDAAGQSWKNCAERVANEAVRLGKQINRSEQDGTAMFENLLIADLMEDKRLGRSPRRSVADILNAGKAHGYDHKVFRDFLRDEGAMVAENAQKHNNRISVRHIQKAVDNGWMVKTSVHFDGGKSTHAVLITQFIKNADGSIKAIRLYDPNVGVLDVPPGRFAKLCSAALRSKERRHEGILVFIRFDIKVRHKTSLSDREVFGGMLFMFSTHLRRGGSILHPKTVNIRSAHVYDSNVGRIIDVYQSSAA